MIGKYPMAVLNIGLNPKYTDVNVHPTKLEVKFSNEEEVLRLGENYRSFTDEAEIEASPFASRIFYRAVETVMSFWDWIKGKIREANNVVNLFCPIADEITLECEI